MKGEGAAAAAADASDGRVLVVLPTYNEADSLPDVVRRVLNAAPHAEVLVIDDASPDGTGAVAAGLAALEARVSVLRRPAKLGLGTAYLAGFALARDRGYRWIVEMDADGSHLPEELPALLAAAHAGASLVVGARWIPGGRIEGWPRHRRFISRTGTRVARLAPRSRLHDITSGFRVLDAHRLPEIVPSEITAQGYAFQVETAWAFERLGAADPSCTVVEVPITFVERRTGRSKMSPGIVFEALRLVIRWGWQLRVAPRRLPLLRSDAGLDQSSLSEMTP